VVAHDHALLFGLAMSSPSPLPVHADPLLDVIELSSASRTEITGLVGRLASTSTFASREALVAATGAHKTALPTEVASALSRLKSAHHEPALLIRGFRVDDVALGRTPAHWARCHPLTPPSPTLMQELVVTLLAESLGALFGYASLQDGRLLHNVLPIAGAELHQSGHGSLSELAWHTEDAFTPHRADHLILMSLRNPHSVATTLAGIDAVLRLDAHDRNLLSQPRYSVRPDDEHRLCSSPPSQLSVLDPRAWPNVVPVLRDGPHGPQIVIDSVYMTAIDPDASLAFERAKRALDANLTAVQLMPGDILVLDNHRVVHGREPFLARHDGTDRWLIKASVTSDYAGIRSYCGDSTPRTLA